MTSTAAETFKEGWESFTTTANHTLSGYFPGFKNPTLRMLMDQPMDKIAEMLAINFTTAIHETYMKAAQDASKAGALEALEEFLPKIKGVVHDEVAALKPSHVQTIFTQMSWATTCLTLLLTAGGGVGVGIWIERTLNTSRGEKKKQKEVSEFWSTNIVTRWAIRTITKTLEKGAKKVEDKARQHEGQEGAEGAVSQRMIQLAQRSRDAVQVFKEIMEQGEIDPETEGGR